MKNYGSLGDSFYKFIKLNIESDPLKLRLSAKRSECGFPVDFAIDQITCRKKNAKKLTRFLRHDKFLFPDPLAAEQASNELVSAYHAALTGMGKNVLDMTAGLGTDSLSICIAGNRVTAIELDENRAAILRHNAAVTGADNFEAICGDSIEYLRESVESSENAAESGTMPPPSIKYDMIFIDPARRGENNRREYFLHDCVPDVLTHKDLIKSHCDLLMIKASPILDIEKTLQDMPEITGIHIISVAGECKEVLLTIDNVRSVSDPMITVIDLVRDKEEEALNLSALPKFRIKSELTVPAGMLGNGNTPIVAEDEVTASNYIYDPNAGIHKLKCGDALSSRFPGLKRLAASTDLYFSKEYYPDFPGRCFRITEIPDKNSLKSKKGGRYEVIARNYPLNAAELMNKLKVKTGSEMYLIGATVGEKRKKLIIECERIY